MIRVLIALSIFRAISIASTAGYCQDVSNTPIQAVHEGGFAPLLVNSFGGLFETPVVDMEEEWRLRFISIAEHFFLFNRNKSVSNAEAKEVLLLVKSNDLAIKHAATIFSYQFVFWNFGLSTQDDCPRFIETMNGFRRSFLQLARDDPAFLREYYRCSLLSDYSMLAQDGGFIPHRGALLGYVQSEAFRGWWEDTESAKLWFQCFVVMVLYGTSEEQRIARFLELETETQTAGFLRERFLWLLIGDAIGLILNKEELRWRSPIGPAGFFHVGYASVQWTHLRQQLWSRLLQGKADVPITLKWHKPMGIPFDEVDPDYLCQSIFSRGISEAWRSSQSFHLLLIRIKSGASVEELERHVNELKTFYGRQQ